MYTNKDAIQLIHSKSIRDFLIDIDYEPTFTQAAWFVIMDENLSLWQKFEIMRDLEKGCKREDYKIKEGIENWILTLDKAMYDFKNVSEDDDVIYGVCPLGSDYRVYSRNYEDCLKHMESLKDGSINFTVHRIDMNSLSEDKVSQDIVEACYKEIDGKHEITDLLFIEHDEDFWEVFDNKPRNIPLPFNNGDIIKNVTCYDSEPVIFEEIAEIDGEDYFICREVSGEEDERTIMTYTSIFNYEYVNKEE